MLPAYKKANETLPVSFLDVIFVDLRKDCRILNVLAKVCDYILFTLMIFQLLCSGLIQVSLKYTNCKTKIYCSSWIQILFCWFFCLKDFEKRKWENKSKLDDWWTKKVCLSNRVFVKPRPPRRMKVKMTF